MKLRKDITNRQFKNSLKRLSGIKGGKVTEDQRRALTRAVGYVAKFSHSTIDDGLFFISAINDVDCQYNMAGAHKKLVQMFTDLVLEDIDMAKILVVAIDSAHKISLMQIKESEKDQKIKPMFK